MFSSLQRPSTPPLLVMLMTTVLFQLIVTEIHGQTTKIDKELLVSVFGPPPVTPPSTAEVTETVFDKSTNEPLPLPSPNACDGTCVPFFMCENNTINTDGTGLIDIRIKPENQCPSYIDVCCDKSMTKKENSTLSVIDKRVNCGHWNSDGVGFKITGNSDNEAEFGEFPWMVAILTSESVNPSTPTYLCGGSLIHPKVVLTAAHCINKKRTDELMVRAGEWDSKIEVEVIPHQDRKVSKIIKHEKYSSGPLHYDIALIFCTDPFVLRDNVGTICLPPQGFQFTSETCYASGWGKNVFGKQGVYQNILKKIDLPIVSHDTCSDKLKQSRLGNKYVLHESFICAGGEIGKDTCKGDGGSPMMCPTQENPRQFHQAGIVSWGIGCGTDVPGVYANVALFRDWIDQLLLADNLDTSYYDANYSSPPLI